MPIFALLLAVAPFLQAAKWSDRLVPNVRDKGEKFYVTGYQNHIINGGNGCTVPPIIVYGTDRFDALTNITFDRPASLRGTTIWTEGEWEKMKYDLGDDFDKDCIEQYGHKSPDPIEVPTK